MKETTMQPYERCSCNDHCDGTPRTCDALRHQCKDGSEFSPLPWKMHRRTTPFTSWIGDATGGVVCTGFGASDERLLLSAHRLLHAVETMLTAKMEIDENEAIDALWAIVTEIRGGEPTP